MSSAPYGAKRVAAYTLYAWEHPYPTTRLVAPWQKAGVELLRGTQWDQVYVDQIAEADVIHIHRDFPRLAKSYQQIMDQARRLNKPVLFDLDDLLFELPDEHPDRQFHYLSDAFFPVLQAIVEANAVTVSSSALLEAIIPLNPNTWLLPTCLDDGLWPLKEVEIRQDPHPLIIGWIHDQGAVGEPNGFTASLERFLRQREATVLLRVWGEKPPASLLSLPNLDWLPEIPIHYPQFAAHFSDQHFDLVVVPHGDGPYFRCQSPLRFLEHSATGLPGVYNQLAPYQDVITHSQNGWLASTAEEWFEGLEKLAGSVELRRQIAVSAQQSVREKWLLSSNAYRWVEAFDNVTSAAVAHHERQPIIDQVIHISSTVRHWQRNLERRKRDRDWEVRALDLMMKRKDRQASAHIEQLGSQLEELWNDPAWRILHKAQRLVKMATAPGDLVKSIQRSQPPDNIETATAEEQGTLSKDWIFSNQTERFPPARTYDVIFFTDDRWEQAPKYTRTLAAHFAEVGSRVFVVSEGETLSKSPILQQVADNIFELTLPITHQNTETDILANSARINQHREWFNDIRLEAGIHAAICWIEIPIWANLAYHLRNDYGWRVVYTQPEGQNRLEIEPFLHLRTDLIFHPFAEKDRFTEIQQVVMGLFPRASIVVLTYNNLDYTQQCLDSIYAKTVYPNYEVIVVDNASTDGTPEYLQSFAATHPNVRVVLNGENRGFSAGNNQGVEASSGEYIVFLNNDTVVTSGWLSGLISHLRDPGVGAVGPVTNFAGNESRIAVDYSDISGLDDFARRYTQAHAGESFEIGVLALFCMVVRRTVIDDVGLLDERFNVGMYEDDDFSLRMRQKGYHILCAENVYIHHWGSASFSQLAAERYQQLHLENRLKFEEKWGTEWQPHRWRMDEE